MTALPAETRPLLPLVVRTTRYLCPSCSRGHSKMPAAVAHMGRCWHNPDNRACKTCTHHLPAVSEPDVGYNSPEGCAESIDITGGIAANCPHWAADEDGAP